MKCKRNEFVTDTTMDANGRSRMPLRIGSAVLCAVVMGTMISAAPAPVKGMSAFVPSARAEEGNDLFSQFFGTNENEDGSGEASQSGETDPFASLETDDTASTDDSFASFFDGSTSSNTVTVDPGTVQPQPIATTREAKYAGPAPDLQQKFLTDEYYYANPDFVGYLTSGVSVSVPVPYSRDNEYYLTHNFMLEEDVAGAAFMDMRCSLWPRSQQIVIHGHNQKDKSIFGSLDDMRSESELKKHPIVEFDTIYEDGTYVIFAAFNASMNTDDSSYFNLERYNFDTQADFDSYIAEVRERSMFDIPIDVNYEDELLTLVTCSYYQDNGRFILFSRRLRADETVESVSALVQQAEKVKEH